jgi:hypothetical protein
MAIGGILSGIGMGVNLISKLVTARKQKKLANNINPNDPEYQVSQQAKDGLSRAQQMYGGRMAGATAMEKNIQANQANFQASVERNAGSGADALAMAAVGNSQANQSAANLAQMEQQNKIQMNQVLTGAEGTMIGETDKVFGDKLRKYTEAVQAKNALMNASYQNRAGAFSDLAQGGLMMLGSGVGQGLKMPRFGGLMGKGGQMASVSNTPMATAQGMNPVVGGGGIAPGFMAGRSFTPSFLNPMNTEARWKTILGN